VLRAAILALLLGFGAASSASADDLLRPGDTITGKLRFFQHQLFNGTWFPVYQIASDHDAAKKRSLDRLLGKRIGVVLDSFFCSETAWHVGDAVATQWHFAEPPKR